MVETKILSCYDFGIYTVIIEDKYHQENYIYDEILLLPIPYLKMAIPKEIYEDYINYIKPNMTSFSRSYSSSHNEYVVLYTFDIETSLYIFLKYQKLFKKDVD